MSTLRERLGGTSEQRRALAGLALLAAAVVLFVLRIDRGLTPSSLLFHPEAIYPAALLEDLPNWQSWSTPYAPYYLPDLALFFVARVLGLGDVVVALYWFAILQLLLIVWLSRQLVGAALQGADREWTARVQRGTVLAGAVTVLLMAVDLPGRGGLQQLATCAFHTGTLVLALLAARVLLPTASEERLGASSGGRRGVGRISAGRFSAGRVSGRSLALAILVALAVLSDQLFLVVFAVPAVIALLLARGASWSGWRGQRLVAIVSGSGAAFVLAAAIRASDTIRVPAAREIDVGAVVAALLGWWRDTEGPLRFALDRYLEGFGFGYRVWCLAWLITTALVVWQIAGRRRRPLPVVAAALDLPAEVRSRLAFLGVLTLVSVVVLSVATLVVTVGRYGLPAGAPGVLFVNRYLVSVYALPLLSLGVLVGSLLPVPSSVPSWVRWSVRGEWLAVSAVAVAALLVARSLVPLAPFPAFEPQGIACVDGLARTEGLRYGLAHFTEARRLNVFTQSEIHFDQVGVEFEKVVWIANRERPGEQLGYRVVVLGGFPQARVTAAFGVADRSLRCGSLELWLYDERRFLP